MTNIEQYQKNVDFLLSDDFSNWGMGFDMDDSKEESFICIKIKEETRAFYPLEFCECFFATSARKADNAKLSNGKSDLNKQTKIFVSCKTNITSVIERYKRFAQNNPQLKKYDFESFMTLVDTAITESKLNVELKLLENQIQTNESSIEANRIGKVTNIYIAIFTFIAAEYYCYEFLRDYISDLNQYKRTIINLSLFALALLGTVGYLRIRRQPQPKNKMSQP